MKSGLRSQEGVGLLPTTLSSQVHCFLSSIIRPSAAPLWAGLGGGTGINCLWFLHFSMSDGPFISSVGSCGLDTLKVTRSGMFPPVWE